MEKNIEKKIWRKNKKKIWGGIWKKIWAKNIETKYGKIWRKKGEADIKIKFIGLRPGEKLHESLFHEDENLRQSSCDGIQICNARNINHEILEDQLNKLERSCRSCDTVGTINILTQLVPEANILEMSKEDIGTP